MVFSIYKHIEKPGGVLLVVLCFMVLPHTCLAQTSIRGTVVDDYGYPVQGAIVHLKGEKTGPFTNKEGG